MASTLSVVVVTLFLGLWFARVLQRIPHHPPDSAPTPSPPARSATLSQSHTEGKPSSAEATGPRVEPLPSLAEPLPHPVPDPQSLESTTAPTSLSTSSSAQGTTLPAKDAKTYTVGWICAITTEFVAAQEFLDEEHGAPEFVQTNDTNNYALGKIGRHHVVIAVLPESEYGTASAANVATNMLNSFPNIRIGLMVGIGGGVPSEKHDIRLGDIVVSTPGNGEGGVFQYDFGKTIQDQAFQHTRFLNQPPTIVRTAVAALRGKHERKGHQIKHAVKAVLDKNIRLQQKYGQPHPSSDRLFRAEAVHNPEGCALFCARDPSSTIIRKPTRADDPTIHYGLVASANQLMKDAKIRDQLAAAKDVLCFEMEAAGLMNTFPCLVIRGICDYSDSHKNKEWQGYAAMTAAAYAKDLLYQIAPNQVEAERRISEVLSSVQETVSRTELKVEKMRSTLMKKEDRKVLDWLANVNYGLLQSDYRKMRQQGTGQWLLESEKFEKWMATKQQTLFCPGIPGAGKTILTSLVVDHLEQQFKDDPAIAIAYVYCNFHRQYEQSVIDLLSSLLKQLAASQSSLPDGIKKLHDDHEQKRTRPSLDEILGAFQSTVKTFSRVFIIVDALDECQTDNRMKLMSELFHLQDQHGWNIFSTSRPIPGIVSLFDNSVSLEIRASTEDVKRYLEHQMEELPSFVQENQQLQETIKAEISESVDGMFLLARIYLGLLDDKTTVNAIQDSLESFKKQGRGSAEDQKTQILNNAYDQTVDRINGQKPGLKKLATEVLSWITCAKRPLSISELQHALATREGSAELDQGDIPQASTMISVCLGLVAIDDESNIIRLVHYTTQEYFEQKQCNLFPDAETDITKACVTYLSFEVFNSGCSQTQGDMKKRLDTHVLYDYASKNWGHHARESPIEDDELILRFLRNFAQVSASRQAMTYNGNRWSFTTTSRATSLHISAYFGLSKLLSILLEINTNVNPEDENGRTPLSLAAENGHEGVVKLLLEKNADVGTKKYGPTPLLLAAENGHEGVVKLLLERNTDTESKGSDYGQTPLLQAAKKGHEGVVKLLLGKKVDIESEDNYGRTPLSLAAKNGQEGVVQLLLEKHADIESKDTNGWTPLLWAADSGHEGVVLLLLEKHADTEAKDNYGQTPLSLAAENGHEGVVKLLLDKNVDTESKERNYGQTPLLQAAKKGHEGVVKLLLDKNDNIESQDDYERTPLSLAAENGHEGVVKLLLDKNADIEPKENIYGQTPLLRAAREGHEGVARLLLEKHADIESHDDFGRTPLSLAAENRHERVVKLLLEKHADIESQDDYGRTPLSWAAENGHEGVVQLLLEKNADIESKDTNERTPLSWAADRGYEGVVKLLLEKNADIESMDNLGRTPLSWAAEEGHESIVNIIQQHRQTL